VKTSQSKKKLRSINPLGYIDLLVLTLTNHEKELSLIIEKLERISEKLEELSMHIAKDEKP